MPLNTLDPLSAFGVGQQIGKADSPVTGIGIAIQRVVDDARKRGLLQSQSQFQAEASNQVNIAKEGRAEERLALPKSTIIAGDTEAEDRTIESTRGADVKLGKTPDPFAQFLAAQLPQQPTVDKDKPSKVPLKSDTSGDLISQRVALANKLELENPEMSREEIRARVLQELP